MSSSCRWAPYVPQLFYHDIEHSRVAVLSILHSTYPCIFCLDMLRTVATAAFSRPGDVGNEFIIH
jgi:hypothetical protein